MSEEIKEEQQSVRNELEEDLPTLLEEALGILRAGGARRIAAVLQGMLDEMRKFEEEHEECTGCEECTCGAPAPKPREVPNTNEIVMHLHCSLCLHELPPGESPQSYARRDVGFTEQGIQVWCVRHNVNIMHMDFQGQKHPANSSRPRMDGEGVGQA